MNLLITSDYIIPDACGLLGIFYDIDGNGINELLVGANGSIGTIYSYDINTNISWAFKYEPTADITSFK